MILASLRRFFVSITEKVEEQGDNQPKARKKNAGIRAAVPP